MPFPTEHRIRTRLRKLAQSGWVRSFPYATTLRGTLHYYKITKQGFQLLFGETTPVPRSHFFRAVAFARQPHTKYLADILVHTAVLAHQEGIIVDGLEIEPALNLKMEGTIIRPDAAFDLVTTSGKRFHFYVELDNGTEPVRAKLERNALQEKFRRYERLGDVTRDRFRVLFITTGGVGRIRNVLNLAADMASEPDRWLIYGITVDGFLSMPSLRSGHLLNHAQHLVSMVDDTMQSRIQHHSRKPLPVGKLQTTAALT